MLISFPAVISTEPDWQPDALAIQVYSIVVNNNPTSSVEMLVRADFNTLDMLPLYPQLFIHVPKSACELDNDATSTLTEEVQIVLIDAGRVRLDFSKQDCGLSLLIQRRLGIEKQSHEKNWEIVAEKPILATA